MIISEKQIAQLINLLTILIYEPQRVNEIGAAKEQLINQIIHQQSEELREIK